LESGLPEDNTQLDDPKLNYAWDEFDDRFLADVNVLLFERSCE